MKRLAIVVCLSAVLPALVGCGCHSCFNKFQTCSCELGCGGVYWGDWYENPPAACPSCDRCANWLGPPPEGEPVSGGYYGGDTVVYEGEGSYETYAPQQRPEGVPAPRPDPRP